jgi:hypothetical protein
LLSCPLACLLALGAAANPTDQLPPSTAKSSKAGKSSAVQVQTRFEEAQTIRQAYILLAGADHDYNGHRAAAMAALKHALKHLDEHVLRHGTAQMKTDTTQGQAAVASAVKVEKHSTTRHEAQAASDSQLTQAAQLLGQVRGAMSAHKQTKPLAHVDQAIADINTALKIR